MPFVKILPEDVDRTTKSFHERERFRKDVLSWDKGQFATKFDLAFDLSEKVAKALIHVITREFLKSRVQKRLASKPPVAIVVPEPAYIRPPSIPDALIRDVLTRRAVLFAGAGMSLNVGLPTAAAFAEYLRQSIREIDPGYSGAGLSFAAAAADFEALASRERLITKVKEMLHPPQGLSETKAHHTAVRAFDYILTTNWDDLIEKAILAEGDNRQVISGELQSQVPSRALIKLHGTLDNTPELLLTEADVSRLDRARPVLWAELRRLLSECTVVVVGTSLRDPSIVKLFEEAAPRVHGYFIAPEVDAATRARLKRWNLVSVRATADDFFFTIFANMQRVNGAG